ncbi:hypothetical protein Gotur_021887 [Gossypium turneri]
MGKNVSALCVIAPLLLLGAVSSAPTTSSPARILNGFFSNALSASLKWLWSLKTTTKTGGYTIETVFDGSKLGIEPHTVEVLPNGELLILDSANSNLYRISASLSLCKPRLVAGSPEGYPGHVDGKPRDARMNHPKGLAVDDRGNIYISDTMNMAIRKISDAGVTTIAGGKWNRGGRHVDGPSEDARFSDDFDVVYVGSSCSVLVIDRGNRAIREIQLHFDDCAYQNCRTYRCRILWLHASSAATSCRHHCIIPEREYADLVRTDATLSSPYHKPMKMVRPPLIPTEEEQEKQDEGFFGSLRKLVHNGGVSILEIFRKKSPRLHQQQPNHSMPWPTQESFVIPDEDEPPPIDTRAPTPRKTYPFMSKYAEKIHQLRQSRVFYNGWDADPQQQQHHRYLLSAPRTYYEQSHEKSNEIIFGAVQERDRKRESMTIKSVDNGNNSYDHQNIRSRSNSFNRGY